MNDIASLYEDYVLGNYGKPALNLTKAEGVYVWDDADRRYIDFAAGIAVNSLGHAHPKWVEKISEQLKTLAHCSNLYAHEPQGLLAQKLVQQSGAGKVLLCNSGAEANEALLKLARLHGKKLTGEEGKRFKVITAENAFHGRTFGGMAATPQEKIQGGFRPMVPGFSYGKLNDIDSFKKLIDDETAAVLVETIQGEGGIHPATTSFLQDLRQLTAENDVLLLIDEVQCGIGRSGHFFAYEPSGIQPDAIGMAKGLGGGFPIGAVWISETYQELFTPGSHGTTFGGNPMACAAALAVLAVIEEDNILENVTANSQVWHAQLQQLKKQFPDIIAEVRGRGYMVGLALKIDHLPIVKKLREAGLLTVPAAGQVVRLLPPLTATQEDLDSATTILSATFASWNEQV